VKIRFSLYSEAIVTIEIYDWALDLVKKLQVGRIQPKYGGEELLVFWDGRNENGDVVANGVYFYKIKTDKGAEAFGKIVVLD
jgi:flagellar hook assembly protein FlgD